MTRKEGHGNSVLFCSEKSDSRVHFLLTLMDYLLIHYLRHWSELLIRRLLMNSWTELFPASTTSCTTQNSGQNCLKQSECWLNTKLSIHPSIVFTAYPFRGWSLSQLILCVLDRMLFKAALKTETYN